MRFFKKVKGGEIKASKIGRVYAIPKKYFNPVLGGTLTKTDKEEIDRALKKMVREYGETLRLLGKD